MDWGVSELLASRAQEIAKGWLLLLLERAPLEAAGAIPAAALAAEGPALCAAVARALGSEEELARLRPGGDLAPLAARAGALAGARDAAGAAAAVDALRACVWSLGVDDGGPVGGAEQARAFAERLATVTTAVLVSALGGAGAASAPAERAAEAVDPQPNGDGPRRDGAAARVRDAHRDGAPALGPDAHRDGPAALHPDAHRDGPAPLGPAPLDDADLAAGARFRDERGHGERGVAAFPGAHEDAAPFDLFPDPRDDADAGADGGSVTPFPQVARDANPAAAAEMDDGDLWIATLERHIDRCRREGGGLALLRVELVDAERLAASAPAGDAGVPYGHLAQAVRRAIRRQDLVASDHQGRAWVIAPGVGRAGAVALAERIGVGVEQGEPWQGAPLAATIGFAVLGEDGRDAATLIDRAEEAMLAATAAGLRIGEAAPRPDGGDLPGPRLVR